MKILKTSSANYSIKTNKVDYHFSTSDTTETYNVNTSESQQFIPEAMEYNIFNPYDFDSISPNVGDFYEEITVKEYLTLVVPADVDLVKIYDFFDDTQINYVIQFDEDSDSYSKIGELVFAKVIKIARFLAEDQNDLSGNIHTIITPEGKHSEIVKDVVYGIESTDLLNKDLLDSIKKRKNGVIMNTTLITEGFDKYYVGDFF